jgi:Spy/CpxP family protein refolding chaperone
MWMVLGLTLLSGVGLGVALDRLVLDPAMESRGQSHDRDEHRRRYVLRLERALDLSPEQKAGLEEALEAHGKKARECREDARSEYAKLGERFREDVRALLTPEQRDRFDEMLARKKHGRRDDKHRR